MSVPKRPGTLILVGFLLAWFLIELLVLYVSGEQTAQWWFYLRKPDVWPPTSFTAGILFSPLSHHLHDFTHITGNVVMLLTIGWFVEPPLGTRKLVGVTVLSAYAGMFLGIVLAPLFRMWPVAGLSGGIYTLLVYSGFTLHDVIDAQVFGSVPNYARRETERYGYVPLAVFFLLLGYEIVFTGNIGHTIGLLIGFVYYRVETRSSSIPVRLRP